MISYRPGLNIWMSPRDVAFAVSASHIAEVCRAPERFQLSRDVVLAAYAEHDETVGSDGHAQEHLIRRLISDGWVRVQDRKHVWTVNMHERSVPRAKSLVGQIKDVPGQDIVKLDAPGEVQRIFTFMALRQ